MASQSNRLNHSMDPREVGTYTLAEAAHYLRIPPATVRSWVMGRRYPVRSGQAFFQPVIARPRSNEALLSFVNLIEAHVLDAIRRQHDVPLHKARTAMRFLERHFGSKHPLADQRIETDGRDLFVQKLGSLINISQNGQLAMRQMMEAHLKRIEWDQAGLAVRLFPFTRRRQTQEPRVIVIDPYRSFGRPVLAGTGIPTAIIAERYKAGESVDELAEDYGRKRLDIEEAIRCELLVEAA